MLFFTINVHGSTKLNKYKYMDEVKVINKTSFYVDCNGIVEEIYDNKYYVSGLCGQFKNDYFNESDLQLVKQGDRK